jgi:type IV pilus assembly protein PilM
MSGKVVTLYINDNSLRLLVAKGKQVRKWATLPLEPGLVRDGVIVAETEVAAKITELLKTQGVKTKKVVAGLSGLHCLSRVIALPQLSKTLLAEAVKREAERVVPVPLEQLYISWQIIPSSEEELSPLSLSQGSR